MVLIFYLNPTFVVCWRQGCLCTCSRFESDRLCCGETLEQQEAGSTMDVVAAQTKAIAGICISIILSNTCHCLSPTCIEMFCWPFF